MEEMKEVANSLFIKLIKIGFVVLMFILILFLVLGLIWEAVNFLNSLVHHISNSWNPDLVMIYEV